jgi:transposase
LEDLVFLDESGFSLTLYRLYGWGRKGEPLVESVPFCRGVNLSVLGAFTCAAGMIARTSKSGAFKREDFERFLHEDLLPGLPVGSVLVLDNARIHHGGQIEKMVREAGCSLLYLPPYSPDFSPIELAWSWIKRFVRERAPRDEAARARAIEQAIAALPAAHAPGWCRYCGYLQS